MSAGEVVERLERLRAGLPLEMQGRVRRARELLRRAGEASGEDLLPTSLPVLDHLLDGGLPRGALVELVGARSSGRFALVLAALAAATRGGEAAALVDLGGHLDPQAALQAGCDLERLLWAWPEHLREALAATETLLVGGFPLVALDLGNPPLPGGRGADASWLRLARTAAVHRVALLVAAPYRVAGTSAAAVLRARPRRPAWRGAGCEPLLLAGMRSQIVLEKRRGGSAASATGAGLDLERRTA